MNLRRFSSKILCIVAIVLLNAVAFDISAQDLMGINGSNYGGTAGLLINPSSMSNFPPKWEIHILTMDFFVDNNYAYMPSTSVISGIKKINKEGSAYSPDESDFVFRNDNIKKKSAYVNFLFKAPSVLFKIKDHRIALINNGIRTVVSANKINFNMPSLTGSDELSVSLNDLNFRIPKFRINAMAWSEFGLSYSAPIRKTRTLKIFAGVTLKRLHGYVAGYLLNDEVSLTVDPKAGATAKVNIEYGYVDPSQAEPSYSGFVSGKGFSGDVGVTAVFKGTYRDGGIEKIEDGPFGPTNYKFRIGLSLIDMGRINFEKNVNLYAINKVTTIDTITDMDILINNELYQLPTTPQPSGSFFMRTPMAISLQADYKIRKNLFVHGIVVQRLVFNGPGIDRANQLAITPRFELKWFEFSLPIRLFQYKHPSIGAALRIGPLWIGSDKIGSWFIPGKFTGTDIYISLRILPIPKPKINLAKPHRNKKPTDMPCSFQPYKSTRWLKSLIQNLKNRRSASKFRTN